MAYRKSQKKISVTVADEGGGIEKGDLTRLTDPFFTTRREHGGTGLGLSVSAGIAKAYGGKLVFTSEKGKGTEARLELPASSA